MIKSNNAKYHLFFIYPQLDYYKILITDCLAMIKKWYKQKNAVK